MKIRDLLNNTKINDRLKLFVVGIGLLWLFLKSPLNSLYNDSGSQELIFVHLKFIYWIIVVFFVFWLIFFVKRDNFNRLTLTVYLFVYGLFLCFFIFYGYDVTDTGFTLSKQWAMYNGMWKENFDFLAGSNLIGGLWLAIPRTPLVIWARLGFVAIQIITSLTVYKIMLLYFKPKEIFIPVLSFSLFFTLWHFYYTINYDNLPHLFLLVSVYLVLKPIQDQNINKLYYIGSGILVVLAGFCKITYYTSFLLPVLLILIGGGGQKAIKEKASYFFYGIILCLGFLGVFMHICKGLDNYLYNIFYIFGELLKEKDHNLIYSKDHSIYSMYWKYTDCLRYFAANSYKIFTVLIIFAAVGSKLKNIKILRYLAILILSIAAYIFLFNDIYGYDIYGRIMALVIVIYIILSISNAKTNSNIFSLITAGSGLVFFAFIGSDLVFRPVFHTLSGVIFFSTPLILLKNSEISLGRIKFKLNLIYYFMIAAILVTTLLYKKTSFYREMEFKYLDETFKTPSLAGIKSFSKRVDVTDSLITFMSNYPDLKNKKIIFTHNNPMMYYLLDLNYPMEYPWDTLNELNTLEANLKIIMPDVFVIPKLSHRLSTWPILSAPDAAEKKMNAHYKIYSEFVNTYPYTVIYENSFYLVYKQNGGLDE